MQHAVREFGQTIVMVTHDPMAASYADRAVFLADGRIVDEIDDPTADSVLDRMQAPGGLKSMLRLTIKNIAAQEAAAAQHRASPCSSASPSWPAPSCSPTRSVATLRQRPRRRQRRHRRVVRGTVRVDLGFGQTGPRIDAGRRRSGRAVDGVDARRLHRSPATRSSSATTGSVVGDPGRRHRRSGSTGSPSTTSTRIASPTGHAPTARRRDRHRPALGRRRPAIGRVTGRRC